MGEITKLNNIRIDTSKIFIRFKNLCFLIVLIDNINQYKNPKIRW